LTEVAISIPENGSCAGWNGFEGALRKKPFVAWGYKKMRRSPLSPEILAKISGSRLVGNIPYLCG